MKKSVQIRIAEIVKMAREQGKQPTRNIRTVGTSSLHQIIKTKEQADRFMKALKEA